MIFESGRGRFRVQLAFDKTESAHDVTRGIFLERVALIRRLASSRGGLPDFAMLPDGSIASDDTNPRGPSAPCPHHAPFSRHESSQSALSCQSSTTTGSGLQPTSPRRNAHMINTPVHEARASATIRQHYYPEGGWGWLITACVFMVHVLTTGMQLSYGILLVEIVRHFGSEYITEAVWNPIRLACLLPLMQIMMRDIVIWKISWEITLAVYCEIF
uniref:Monocarboxylate transporter n=1 Tax=Strigamia maritima TaxID=126957 RepID=T1JMV0_STRMM